MDLFAQDGEKQVAYPSFKWSPNLQVSLSTMQEVSQIHSDISHLFLPTVTHNFQKVTKSALRTKLGWREYRD